MILGVCGEESFALLEYPKETMGPQPQENVCIPQMYYLVRELTYGPSDIMYELGLWNSKGK